jgi:hypothetical protein
MKKKKILKVVEKSATGFWYEEDLVEYDRSQHKYAKTKIKRFVPPDSFALSTWIEINKSPGS